MIIEAATFLGADLKGWYGVGCLAMGLVLVMGAVAVGVYEVRQSGQLAKQAKAIAGAASTLESAANQMTLMVGSATGDQAQAMTEVANDVAAKAGEAKERAAESADFFSITNTIAAKSPLAAAGILFVVLGAGIMGYVTVTVGA